MHYEFCKCDAGFKIGIILYGRTLHSEVQDQETTLLLVQNGTFPNSLLYFLPSESHQINEVFEKTLRSNITSLPRYIIGKISHK